LTTEPVVEKYIATATVIQRIFTPGIISYL
jgi:hypothetical protein